MADATTETRAAHTKGPWEVRPHESVGYGDPNVCAWAIHEKVAELQLATVMGDIGSAAEARANADLYAASPDLYAVVQDMLSGFRYVRDRMSRGEENPWYGFGIKRLEETGAAAIAKATGAAP